MAAPLAHLAWPSVFASAIEVENLPSVVEVAVEIAVVEIVVVEVDIEEMLEWVGSAVERFESASDS